MNKCNEIEFYILTDEFIYIYVYIYIYTLLVC